MNEISEFLFHIEESNALSGKNLNCFDLRRMFMFDLNDFLTNVNTDFVDSSSYTGEKSKILFHVDEQKLLISMSAVLSLISYTIYTNRCLVRERHWSKYQLN